MKQYLISKTNYNGEVVYLNISKDKGYRISPKNKINYDGVKVNEMVFIKPEFIQKIIKRKLRNKLDLYLNFLICEDTSDDDTRKALDDIQRYRFFVKEKYSLFLDDKYMLLLNNKFDIIERNLKTRIVKKQLEGNEQVEEYRRSR